jgi:nitrite reductase/ring-hydroxylating ferredoxin subunit
VVERALVAGVPGLHQVEVVPAEPEAVMIPLGSLGLRWTPGPSLEDLDDGRVTLWSPGAEASAPGRAADDARAVALVRIGDAVAAYRNACAHMGFSLEKAMVDGEGGVLTCSWHGYKYQALTGECISAVDTRLEAYPARVDGGRVWVRLQG